MVMMSSLILTSCADTKANILRRVDKLSTLGCNVAYMGYGLSTPDVICIADCYQASCFHFKEYLHNLWEFWWVLDPAGVHDVALRHWHLVLDLLVSNVVTKGYCIKPRCEIHTSCSGKP